MGYLGGVSPHRILFNHPDYIVLDGKTKEDRWVKTGVECPSQNGGDPVQSGSLLLASVHREVV